MRIIHWLITALLGVLVATGGAYAQPRYPTRPIRLVVPFTPGGGVDIVARMLAQKLAESFGGPVIVDNRPGAAGTIGTETVVRANPDGYTMVLVSATYATNAVLHKLPYDATNDVAPIALIAETGFIVTLHPSVPVSSIKELIVYDNAKPGRLNYGSSGTGGSLHLAAELFNQMAGTKLTHVPYKGASAAVNDLLGGQIQIIFVGVLTIGQHLKSNRLRGIAVTTTKRSNAVPDIPTVSETVPGYEVVQWFAVLGPKGLPKEIVARWNREINRIVQLPEVKERMAGQGVEPTAGSPERLRETLKRDIEKWQKVVKTAGIKPES